MVEYRVLCVTRYGEKKWSPINTVEVPSIAAASREIERDSLIFALRLREPVNVVAIYARSNGGPVELIAQVDVLRMYLADLVAEFNTAK